MGKKLQPKLRFRGFTDAWEQRRFVECFDFLKTNTFPRDYLQLSGNGTVDIHYGDILINYNSCLSIANNALPCIKREDYLDCHNYSLLKDGDVVFADTAEDRTVGKCVELLKVGERRALAGLHTIAVRNRIECAVGYLGFYFNSPFYRKQLLPKMQGSKVVAISKDVLKQSFISVPSTKEQLLISKLLNKIDSLVDAEKRKLLLLEQKREAYSQKVFSYGSHHGEDAKHWKMMRLGDIATRITRRNKGRSNLPLTISARDGLIDQRHFFSKQVASKNLDNYILLQRGEFAYNKSTSSDSPWGTIKRLDRYDQGCVSTLYICFSTHSVDSQFITTLFNSPIWHREIQAIATEGARNHGLLNISSKDFFDIQLQIPDSLSEQKHIGRFFAAYEQLIRQTAKRIGLLEKKKKALLQTMFI